MLSHMFRTELKGVVKLAVVEAGGQENCANVSARIKRAAAFSDYANPAIEDRHLPIDVALELDAFNGNGRIVGAMARALGFLLIRVPQGRGPAKVMEASGRSAQEMGALMMELGQALADGHLDGPERAAIHERIRHLQVDLAELDAAVDVEAGGE